MVLYWSVMEVTDLNDLLNVRAIKMENGEHFDEGSASVEMSDPLSVIPQYVTESDLGGKSKYLSYFRKQWVKDAGRCWAKVDFGNQKITLCIIGNDIGNSTEFKLNMCGYSY